MFLFGTGDDSLLYKLCSFGFCGNMNSQVLLPPLSPLWVPQSPVPTLIPNWGCFPGVRFHPGFPVYLPSGLQMWPPCRGLPGVSHVRSFHRASESPALAPGGHLPVFVSYPTFRVCRHQLPVFLYARSPPVCSQEPVAPLTAPAPWLEPGESPCGCSLCSVLRI